MRKLNVVVLLSGVRDYRKPLQKPASGQWSDLLCETSGVYRLSPFDEAALETGLKLMAASYANLKIITTNCSPDINLLRTIKAYKPQDMVALDIGVDTRNNPVALAQIIAKHAQSFERACDIWLAGKEHGDLDDGVLMPYLAHKLNLTFVGDALALNRMTDNKIEIECLHEGQLQTVTTHYPVFLGITNDQRNRLRHPLLKNLAEAKRELFNPLASNADLNRTPSIKFLQAIPASMRHEKSTPCEFLSGSETQKAKQLAHWLLKQGV